MYLFTPSLCWGNWFLSLEAVAPVLWAVPSSFMDQISSLVLEKSWDSFSCYWLPLIEGRGMLISPANSACLLPIVQQQAFTPCKEVGRALVLPVGEERMDRNQWKQGISLHIAAQGELHFGTGSFLLCLFGLLAAALPFTYSPLTPE